MARLFKPTGNIFDLIMVLLMVGVAFMLFEELWARLIFYVPVSLVLCAISAKVQNRYWRPAERK